MGVQFTCDACGGTFDKGWSDAEAATESRAVFGKDRTQDPTMAEVCDDCYKAMMMWLKTTEPAAANWFELKKKS
jgi:hypothetical protein